MKYLYEFIIGIKSKREDCQDDQKIKDFASNVEYIKNLIISSKGSLEIVEEKLAKILSIEPLPDSFDKGEIQINEEVKEVGDIQLDVNVNTTDGVPAKFITYLTIFFTPYNIKIKYAGEK